MPWSIYSDHPDCSGYAVVQDDSGRMVGCHETREEAEDQIAALYASDADKEKSMRLTKTYEVVSFKALPDEAGDEGRFEAIVSVFGNVDFQGDRVMPGAFKTSIDRWQESGDPIPVIWSHDWGNPLAHIGFVDPGDVEEVETEGKARNKVGGLKVTGQIDLDNPFAAQVYRLMKERRVKEFSFAYDVIRESPGRDRANELHELDLIEVGPTLKGANPSTELLGVKERLEDAAAEAREQGYDAEGAIRELAKYQIGYRAGDDLVLPEGIDDLMDAIARRVETPEPVLEPEKKNVYAALEGTQEALREDIADELTAWAHGFTGSVEAYINVVGTYSDRVVAELYFEHEDTYWEFNYEVDEDGMITLSNPQEVDPVVNLVPATPGQTSRSVSAKAGRVLSAKSEALVRSIADSASALLAQVEKDNEEKSVSESTTIVATPVVGVTAAPVTITETPDEPDPDAELKAALEMLELGQKIGA